MDSKTETDGMKEYCHQQSQPRREAFQMDQAICESMIKDGVYRSSE